LPQTLSIWFNDPLGLLSDSLNRDVLPTYTVTGKHTQQTLQNTYWNLVNKGISFDRVKDNNLRNWLEQNDRLQHYLQRVHDATREQGLMTLRKKGMNGCFSATYVEFVVCKYHKHFHGININLTKCSALLLSGG
jgi:hypothetical protein